MIYESDLLVGDLYMLKLIEVSNSSALIIWLPSFSANDFVCSVVRLEEYGILVSIIDPPKFDNQFNIAYIGKNKNIKLSKRWPYCFITSDMIKLNISEEGLKHINIL